MSSSCWRVFVLATAHLSGHRQVELVLKIESDVCKSWAMRTQVISFFYYDSDQGEVAWALFKTTTTKKLLEF